MSLVEENKPLFIAFSGLDGAGKSTQIQLINDAIRKKGLKSETLWARGGYTPIMKRVKKCLRKSSSKILPQPGDTVERTKKFQSPWIRYTWLIVSVLDLALYWGIWVRWKHLNGFYVLADRYLIDTKLDFEINFPKNVTLVNRLVKILSIIIPNPHVQLIFSVPIAESIRRSERKKEPYPDNTQNLQKRLYEYQSLNGKNVFQINGTEDQEAINKYICEILKI